MRKNDSNDSNKFHVNRLKKYFKENNMNFSESFDDFFKSGKENISKEEWERLVKNLQFKKVAVPNMVVMVEEDYENLIEMRGLFKNTHRPEYVNTINKILGTLNPSEGK
jgi:hypothetical protein